MQTHLLRPVSRRPPVSSVGRVSRHRLVTNFLLLQEDNDRLLRSRAVRFHQRPCPLPSFPPRWQLSPTDTREAVRPWKMSSSQTCIIEANDKFHIQRKERRHLLRGLLWFWQFIKLPNVYLSHLWHRPAGLWGDLGSGHSLRGPSHQSRAEDLSLQCLL